MIRYIFEKLITKYFPDKIIIIFILALIKLNRGGFYLYKTYKSKIKIKNQKIEDYFINKYPDKIISKKKTLQSSRKDKKLSRRQHFINKLDSIDSLNDKVKFCESESKTNTYLWFYEQYFNLLILANNSVKMTSYLYKMFLYFPSSITANKCLIIAAKNEEFHALHKDFIYKNIHNSIIKGNYHSSLINFMKYQLISKRNSDILPLVLLLQSKIPLNEKLLVLLGDYYKSENMFSFSENYYFYLKGINYDYGIAKLVSLYSDYECYSKGTDVLYEFFNIKKNNDKELYRVIPMLLRISSFYNNLSHDIYRLRDSFCKKILSNGHITENKIKTIIRCRYMPGVVTLIPHVYEDISKYSNEIFNTIENIQSHSHVLDFFMMAHNNDDVSNDLMIFTSGTIKTVKREDLCSSNVIELFIPTVFFNLDFEKKIYNTIRIAFINLMTILYREDHIILPRMQYNWRDVDPISNGIRISYHTIFNTDNKKNIVIQESTLDGRVSFDRLGYAGFSDFSKNSFIKRNLNDNELLIVKKFKDNFKENKTSKYNQNSEQKLNISNYIFFPLQVETDIVTKLRHLDIGDAMDCVCKFALEHKINVVFKKHPFCNSSKINAKLEQLCSSYNHVNVLDYSIHDLINKSLFVVTANSGVGLESIFYDKNVVTFGDSDYQRVSLNSTTIIDLEKNLTRGLYTKPANKNYDEFIFEYISIYTAKADDTNEVKKRIDKIISIHNAK